MNQKLLYILPPGLLMWYFSSRKEVVPAAAAAKQAAGWLPAAIDDSNLAPNVQHSSSAASLFLFRVLPLRLQHHMRDSGRMGQLMDFFTYLYGAILFSTRPRLMREFIRGPAHPRIVYGTVPSVHALDIYNSHRSRPARIAPAATASATPAPAKSSLSPAVLFVHGGAWGSGSARMYRLFARRLDREGYVVIVPSYHLYPAGGADVQTADIGLALRWTATNISRFGGDPNRLYVMGHSSGAHILTMLLLRYAQGLHPTSAPLPRVAGVMCLAAPFDLCSHYEYESGRGVHEISPLKPANGGLDRLSEWSPTLVVTRALSTAQARALPPFLLIHGTLDDTVPVRSTILFACALRRAGVAVAMYTPNDVDHASIVLSPMLYSRHQRPNVNLLHTIKQFILNGVPAELASSQSIATAAAAAPNVFLPSRL